jgi:hypothetical protein
MITEKRFRINRFTAQSTLADELCLICAKSNGATRNKITLDILEAYVACEVLKYPYANRDVFITHVDDHHIILEKGTLNNAEPLVEIIEYELVYTPVVDDEANMN